MEQETRTRSRVPVNLVKSGTDRIRVWYPGNDDSSTIPLYSDQSYPHERTYAYKTEEMTDVVTSGYKTISSKGFIVNNPLTQIWTDWYHPIWSGSRTSRREAWSSSKQRWYTVLEQQNEHEMFRLAELSWGGDGFFLDAPSYLDDLAALKSQAVMSAWANISSAEILALVSAVESGKTLQGLLDIYRRLYKFCKNVKRLQLKELNRFWKTKQYGYRSREMKRAWKEIRNEFSFDAICDRYMELRYGIRPLYYDAVGAVNALNKEFDDMRQTFRGSATSEYHNSIDITHRTFKQSWAWDDIYAKSDARVNCKATAGVLTDVDISKMDPWGLTQLPETIWELVPYSFVVDWILNVGDTLGAWSPNIGFIALASWVTLDVTVTQSTQVSGWVPGCEPDTSTKRYYSGASMGGPTVGWNITRTRTRSPDPSRSILPTFNPRLSAAKLIDLALMVRNLLKGGRFPLRV